MVREIYARRPICFVRQYVTSNYYSINSFKVSRHTRISVDTKMQGACDIPIVAYCRKES